MMFYMKNIKNWESKFQPCEYSDKLLNLITELNKTARASVNILEIKKACYYAREYHGSQLRKSGHPYYYHPIEVAYLFALYVGNNIDIYYTTDLIVTAILHDTVEDTNLTYDMIVHIFGKNVADGVKDLTRIKDGVKITAEYSLDLLLLDRKKAIILIKTFDRLHNAMTIRSMPPKKIVSILQETARKFLFCSIYMEAPHVEKELMKICLNYLPQQKTQYKFSSHDNFELPSLV